MAQQLAWLLACPAMVLSLLLLLAQRLAQAGGWRQLQQLLPVLLLLLGQG